MSNRIGTSGKLFTALGKSDVNVRIMIQAFNEINILVGVDESDMEKGIRAIYDAFVKDR